MTNKPHSANTKRLLVGLLEVNCLVKCGSTPEVEGCSSQGGCLMLLRRVLIVGLLLYEYNPESALQCYNESVLFKIANRYHIQ